MPIEQGGYYRISRGKVVNGTMDITTGILAVATSGAGSVKHT
jgi:hypothetical protein